MIGDIMQTLINQLVDDVREEFSHHEEYSNIVVKEIYARYPKLQYPGITIEELENTDNDRFFDETERVSDLGYQFAIYAEQSESNTAPENARAIANILDTYLKGPRYRCLRRIGSPVMAPKQGDDNVMVCYLRYDCSLEIGTNTIYRRY